MENLEQTKKEIQDLLESSHLSILVKELTKAGVLTVKLTGSCANCPSGQAEFEETLETILQEKFPQIKEIRWETGVSEELIQEALRYLRRNSTDHE